MEKQKPTVGEAKATGRKYRSVREMLRKEKFPQDVRDTVSDLAGRTRLSRVLAAMRAKAGLTQQEMGTRVGRSQSAISKLESDLDENLTLGDIHSYAKALNERVGLMFGPPMTHVQAIKEHALAMRARMSELAKLAHDDRDLEREIQAFFGEAFFNILSILAECQQEMPNKEGIQVRLQLFDERERFERPPVDRSLHV